MTTESTGSEAPSSPCSAFRDCCAMRLLSLKGFRGRKEPGECEPLLDPYHLQADRFLIVIKSIHRNREIGIRLAGNPVQVVGLQEADKRLIPKHVIGDYYSSLRKKGARDIQLVE